MPDTGAAVKPDQIILGAADVFMYVFNGTQMPTDSEIETDAHCVGNTQSGASVEYQPTNYEVKNSYGKTVRKFITEEAITVKTGLLTWNLDNLALLSTANITYPVKNAADPKKVLTFKSDEGNSLNKVLVRFRHKKADTGKYLRFTCVAQGGNGFTVNFNENELVVDAELTAISQLKDTYAEFTEELDENEVAYYESAGLIKEAAASA